MHGRAQVVTHLPYMGFQVVKATFPQLAIRKRIGPCEKFLTVIEPTCEGGSAYSLAIREQAGGRETMCAPFSRVIVCPSCAQAIHFSPFGLDWLDAFSVSYGVAWRSKRTNPSSSVLNQRFK